MKTKTKIIILALISMILLISACSSGATTSTTVSSNPSTTLDGATLFQERCSVCHRLPTSARGTADQWKSVVESMVARGANLNSEEQTVLIDYLATNYGK